MRSSSANADHVSAWNFNVENGVGFEPHSALNNPDGGMVGAHAALP
jgi:hypothetical protein